MCNATGNDGSENYAKSSRFDLSKAPPGARIAARAWMRASGGTPRSAEIFFVTKDAAGGSERHESGGGTLRTDAWTHHNTTLVVDDVVVEIAK